MNQPASQFPDTGAEFAGMPALFDRKSLYHSHLVYFTNDQPEGLGCKLVSAVMPGRDRDGMIVKLQPHGDPNSYWLKLENENIVSTLKAVPRDTWVSVAAHGMGADATVTVTNNDGTTMATLPPTPPAEATVPRSTGNGATTYETPGSPLLAREVRTMEECLLAASRLIDTLEMEHGVTVTDQVRTLATTFFIGQTRR